MIAFIETAVGSALTAALLLGLCCGSLGAFVVVRRMALTGDMLSHAVLPGIVAGLVWNESRNLLLLLISAIVSGILGTMVLHGLQRGTRLKPDAALGIVLSVFFAAGIAMISMYQPAGVQAYLYGQAAAIDRRDLILLAGVTAVVLATMALFFRLWHVVSFDAGFARVLGYPVAWLDRLFFFLLATAIVVAMQTVGVVLVSAMLITPAAAARYLSRHFSRVLVASCVIGAVGAVAGVWLSSRHSGWPTGPVMALSVTACFVLVLTCAPHDGWVARLWRKFELIRRIERENLLKAMFLAAEAEGFRHDTVPLIDLAGRLGQPLGVATRRARAMVGRGDALWAGGRSGLRFSPDGLRRAEEIVRNHRLWERYLTDRARFASDHVHDDAERMEHWIDEERARKLEQTLDFPPEDPHGKQIPAVGRTRKEEAP